MHCTVFYSWQSDLPNSVNRGFIQDALERAAKAIRNDDSIEVEPVIDRDTQNVPGSPDIGLTIFQKIEAADIFACDVSLINHGARNSNGELSRLTPNPNVLVELGFAVHALGWERVVLVMNTAYGTIENLPFDLRARRTLQYKAVEGEDNREEKKSLQSKFDSALRSILSHLEMPAPILLAPTVVEQAIKAIETGQTNAPAQVRRFMDWMVQ